MSNWNGIILNGRGELQYRINAKGEEKELRQLFAKANDAERWADRQLVTCSPDCYAVIQSTRMMGRDGKPLAIKIDRDLALSRFFKKPRSVASKTTVSKNAPLSFGMKVKETRVEFSHG